VAVLFTADSHFGHGGALGLFARPFPSVAAMDAALAEAWNEAVGPNDTVWHLGDLAVRAKPERSSARVRVSETVRTARLSGRNGMGKGALNLHGHSHGRLAPMTRQFDVGVDAVGFRPVTVGTLVAGRGRRL
jgi:calcineurin-like phosphoesterase family protein